MSVVRRNNVTLRGRPSGQPMVFAHGFGCDQNMWRFVAPPFEDRCRVVLFDHVGAGGSDLSAYDEDKYASLEGYARDVVVRARRGGGAAAVAQAVVDDVVAFQGGAPRDDIALVVMAVPQGG